MTSLAQVASGSVVITKRNLIKVKRVPDLIVFATLSPIMFVLLFVYVFGSAIPIPGIDYAEFLLPGILAQTVIFGSTITGASIAEDIQKGLIDRFRSLPMARSAVLVGRTAADVGLNSISIVVMVITGLIVGWRIRSSPLEAIAAVALLLGFAYAMSWLMALLGMMVRSPEVINNVSFIVLFPLTFISNAFVPSSKMPEFLGRIADWNPFSATVQACRELFGNPGVVQSDAWPMQHPVWASVIWSVVIILIFRTLAVRKYRSATA
jgi:ABC transporter DrrB family efflux protein